MSDETKAALEAALTAHIAATCDGGIPTDWLTIVAVTDLTDIGTGRTRYFIEANNNQPVHITVGLASYVAQKAPFEDDDDEDEA